MTTTDGIILAGGRGTRLGPLAAQISKALVSVGNRPQVVNQILQLRDAGCEHVYVVTSPDTNLQVSTAIIRAGLGKYATTVIQKLANGPVHALLQGLNATYAQSVLVLFSDTAFTESLPWTGDWVGVSYKYDTKRSWCYLMNNGSYIDGIPLMNHPVTVGAYRFADVKRARSVANAVMADVKLTGEIGMAPFLSGYRPESTYSFTTWTDVGDIFSLAASRHERFVTRPHHKLRLDSNGLLTKTGVTVEEFQFMQLLADREPSMQTLFPTVYDMSINDMSYVMDYIDMPTLAELWLYWPGLPETWQRIIFDLIERLQWSLWKETGEEHAGKWMATKALSRLTTWTREMGSSVAIPIKLLADLADIVGQDITITGHGDLNFTNIMFSLNTGVFKLVDPRGGDVPLIYEYAKLGYSHDFACITHGLIDAAGRPLPSRETERKAVNAALHTQYDSQRLYAAQALIALAAPPLHNPVEAEALYKLGLDYAKLAGL